INPIAAILSVQMMLDLLSVKHGAKLKEGANLIEQAIAQNMKERKVITYDQGGTSKTSDVGDAIVSIIKKI
ncbi:MAG: isocitrate/isopropylmalate family dehydrogenase, partial [Candidatus Helarchaeota archaeon]